jgi:hypothetical protein
VNLAKIGSLTLGGGILAFIISFLPGAGPCGPSTMLGFLIMMGGLLAIPLGLIMIVMGL